MNTILEWLTCNELHNIIVLERESPVASGAVDLTL